MFKWGYGAHLQSWTRALKCDRALSGWTAPILTLISEEYSPVCSQIGVHGRFRATYYVRLQRRSMNETVLYVLRHAQCRRKIREHCVWRKPSSGKKCWLRARGSVDGWCAMLQAGRSRVLFPIRSLNLFIYLIFSAALGLGVYSASNRNEYQKHNVSEELCAAGS
jgi:hypothetical protein